MEIKKSELFSGLSRIEQARLMGSLEKLVLKKGDLLFNVGDPGDSMFIVQKGEVEVFTFLEDGHKNTIANFYDGDILGEMSLLTGNPRSASATAKTDAVVYRMVREKFNQVLDENTFFSSYLLKVLSERLGESNESRKKNLDQNIAKAKIYFSKLDEKERSAILYLTQIPDPYSLQNISLLSHHFDVTKIENIILNSTELQNLMEEVEKDVSFREKLKEIFLPDEERGDFIFFLHQLSEYYASHNESHLAVQLFTYNQLWEEAIKAFRELPVLSEDDVRPSQESIETKEEAFTLDISEDLAERLKEEFPEDLNHIFQQFKDCPVAIFIKQFDFFLEFLRYFEKNEPETGFKFIETILSDTTELSDDHLLDLYRIAADYAEKLELQQKAYEYLNMAKNFSDSKSESGNAEKNFHLERQYLETMRNRDQAKNAGKIIPKTTIAKVLTIFGALFSLLWFGVFSEPLAGLPPEAMWFIGIALATVIFWISEWIPDYVVALFMGFAWVITGTATTGETLSGYASPSWFFMIFVFGVSVALTKTGLLYRLSLWTLKIFPKNYNGQIMGIAVSGILINPFVPSATVKAAMSAPLAKSISESMGFSDNSSGSSGLGLAAMIFHGFLSPFFLTASFANLMALGIAGIEVSWMQWFLYSLPALVFFCAGMYLSIILLYKPGKNSKKLSVDVINQQLSILGKLTGKEKTTIFLTLLSVILLITQTIHGLETVWIMFIPFSLLIITGVLNTKNIKNDIEWGFLIFIGMTFSFAEIVASVGVIDVIAAQVSIFMDPFMDSALLFVLAISLISIAVSFFIKDDTVVILLVVALAPVALIANVNPWIVIFIIILTSGPFFFPYQSAIYLSAYYSSEGKCFTHKQARKIAIAFAIVMILAALISTPFWVWQGLL